MTSIADNGTFKSKVLKMTPSKILWKSDKKEMIDVWHNNKYVSYQTISFKLPSDLIMIENIIINKKIVYDCKGEKLQQSLLAGGGRFVHKRSIYDRCVVFQQITIHDIPNYNKRKELQIEIVGQFFEYAK